MGVRGTAGKKPKTKLQRHIRRVKRMGKTFRFFGNKKNRKKIDKILLHLANVVEEKILWK